MKFFKHLQSDFSRIVAMSTLSGIGTGLIGVFVPIYLLQNDYSVAVVVMWLIVLHATILAGAFMTVYLANSIGLVRCWYIRIALMFLEYVSLFLLPFFPQLIFVTGFLSGLEAAFYWIPYNILTIRKTSDHNLGSSLALMSNIGSIVGIFIPAISAFVIVTLGYWPLFIVSFLFVLVSIIPVLPLTHEKTHFHFNWKHVKGIARTNKHFILPEILDNLGQDAQVMWTIFLFVTALNVLDIGFLAVISTLVGIVVTHLTGKFIDRSNKKYVVRFGAVATTVTWLLSFVVAVYAPTPVLLYLVTTLRGFALGIFASAYGVIMMNRARNFDAQFIVLREIPTIFGRMIVYGLAVFFVINGNFSLTFLVVAVISVYFWFNNLDVLLEKPHLNKL